MPVLIRCTRRARILSSRPEESDLAAAVLAAVGPPGAVAHGILSSARIFGPGCVVVPPGTRCRSTTPQGRVARQRRGLRGDPQADPAVSGASAGLASRFRLGVAFRLALRLQVPVVDKGYLAAVPRLAPGVP